MNCLYRIFHLGGDFFQPRLSPASSGPFGNSFHRAIADDALLIFLRSGVAMLIGKFVLALDEEPVSRLASPVGCRASVQDASGP